MRMRKYLRGIALTAAGAPMFLLARPYAVAERGGTALGGEVVLLLLPALLYMAVAVLRDAVRDFKEAWKNENE